MIVCIVIVILLFAIYQIYSHINSTSIESLLNSNNNSKKKVSFDKKIYIRKYNKKSGIVLNEYEQTI